MAYDLGKISALEAHHQIVDHISRQLASCSAFANNSLAYFGLEISYRIEVTLHSRGKTRETLQAAFPLGEMPDSPEVVRQLGAENAEVKSEHTVITDEQVAGSARKLVDRTAIAPTGTPAGQTGSPDAGTRGGQAGADVGQQQPGSGTEKAQRPAGATGGPGARGPKGQFQRRQP